MVETGNFLSCTDQTRAQRQVNTGLKFIQNTYSNGRTMQLSGSLCEVPLLSTFFPLALENQLLQLGKRPCHCYLDANSTNQLYRRYLNQIHLTKLITSDSN